MSQPFTLEDLQEILTDRVGVPADEVAGYDLDTPFHDLGLDSLAVVELQLAVQQRYGFTVADDEARQIETLRSAVAFVNERIGVPGGVS